MYFFNIFRQKLRFLLSSIVNIAVLLYFVRAAFINDETPQEVHSVVIALSQNLFGVYFAWAVLASESGTFKWIENIIWHKFWKPLSQLSFCIYMVHPIILHFLILKHKEPIFMDEAFLVNYMKFHQALYNVKIIFQMQLSFLTTPLTIVFAVITHFLVEIPFGKLGYLLLKTSFLSKTK